MVGETEYELWSRHVEPTEQVTVTVAVWRAAVDQVLQDLSIGQDVKSNIRSRERWEMIARSNRMSERQNRKSMIDARYKYLTLVFLRLTADQDVTVDKLLTIFSSLKNNFI